MVRHLILSKSRSVEYCIRNRRNFHDSFLNTSIPVQWFAKPTKTNTLSWPWNQSGSFVLFTPMFNFFKDGIMQIDKQSIWSNLILYMYFKVHFYISSSRFYHISQFVKHSSSFFSYGQMKTVRSQKLRLNVDELVRVESQRNTG